jgi:hypothetical protein
VGPDQFEDVIGLGHQGPYWAIRAYRCRAISVGRAAPWGMRACEQR